MPNVPEIKSKILSFIQRNGPSLPVQISKQINENMIFSGAVLSELIANKKIFISTAKIGGSPVYYIQGQEYKLSQVLYPHLKEIYKRAYDLLKKNVILKDNELEPWQRVALRELKDFAVMLNLTSGEIFWKWYLTSDSEAESIIKKILGIVEEKKIEPEKAEPEIKEPEIKEHEDKIEPQKLKKVEKPKKEKQEVLKKEIDLGELENFFNEKKINITDKFQVNKKEINFKGEMNSDLGLVKIFIKFKDKKKISDSDLITAHNESKKLPLYFVSSGDLTKKAQNYVEENFLIFEKLK